MAIDTEQKRRAVAVLPVSPVTLKPDGTISTADRQQIGWGYPGIAAGTAGPPDVGIRTFQLQAAQVYVDGGTAAQVYVGGGAAAQVYVDGGAAAQLHTDR